MVAITENQRTIEELRCELGKCMFRAKEQELDVKKILLKPKGYMKRTEKLKFFIRKLNNALLEI